MIRPSANHNSFNEPTENQLLASFVLIAIGCFIGGSVLLYSFFLFVN